MKGVAITPGQEWLNTLPTLPEGGEGYVVVNGTLGEVEYLIVHIYNNNLHLVGSEWGETGLINHFCFDVASNNIITTTAEVPSTSEVVDALGRGLGAGSNETTPSIGKSQVVYKITIPVS